MAVPSMDLQSCRRVPCSKSSRSLRASPTITAWSISTTERRRDGLIGLHVDQPERRSRQGR